MSAPRTIGSLFAGIGGFDLGLEALGLETRWTCEFADFPRSILEQRFPQAEHFTDVRELRHPPRVDVLTGGFPCQDLSIAGRGKGIGGSRSGLWTEYARIIGEVEPTLVLIENVPALLHRGMELVVENLVELGYSLEWDCLPAAAFGAPHLRDRVWIAAHRLTEPVVFGQPAALFPLEPAGAADLVGGDDDQEDDDDAPAGWLKWPRAGWVRGDAGLVMPLEPLAPIAAVRARAFNLPGDLWPTPAASLTNYDEDPAQFLERKERNAAKDEGATRAGIPLGVAVKIADDPDAPRRYLPTPMAADAAGGRMSKGSAHPDEFGLAEHARRMDAGLLPTPTTQDANNNGGPSQHRRRTPPLNAVAGLLPTPVAGETLLDAASDADGIRWPTPQAADGAGGRLDKDPLEKRPSGHHKALTLNTAAHHGIGVGGTKLPTPRASDGDGRNRSDLVAHAKERPNSHHPGERPEGRENEQRRGGLNPIWVEWLMGFPLGWTDPDVAEPTAWPWHAGEPADVPRVTLENHHRRPRLTALGNALIPPAVAWIGARYLEHAGATCVHCEQPTGTAYDEHLACVERAAAEAVA